jgi:hypothetical protein
MPGEAEVARAALDRDDDLVGDVLVNIEAFFRKFVHIHAAYLNANRASARRGTRSCGTLMVELAWPATAGLVGMIWSPSKQARISHLRRETCQQGRAQGVIFVEIFRQGLNDFFRAAEVVFCRGGIAQAGGLGHPGGSHFSRPWPRARRAFAAIRAMRRDTDSRRRRLLKLLLLRLANASCRRFFRGWLAGISILSALAAHVAYSVNSTILPP